VGFRDRQHRAGLPLRAQDITSHWFICPGSLTSSRVALDDVDQCLIDATCDLEIVGGLHELHTSESARRNDA
jgi:hypothetical protein